MKSLVEGIIQLAILCIYTRRINYNSSTVNISVFIQQRNISFHNYISLKTMRLGVLLWEKLKIHHTYCRNCELGPAWGVKEQLLISLSCLSPGWVKKIQKFINFCLKVCHSGNLKHIKSTWRQLTSCERYKIVTKALGAMHAQHFFIAEQERLIYDNCCFDIGHSRASQLITRVSSPEQHICLSQDPQ